MSANRGKITLAGEDKINATEIYALFGNNEFTLTEYRMKVNRCHNSALGVIRRLEGSKHLLKWYDSVNGRNVYHIPEDTVKKINRVRRTT